MRWIATLSRRREGKSISCWIWCCAVVRLRQLGKINGESQSLLRNVAIVRTRYWAVVQLVRGVLAVRRRHLAADRCGQLKDDGRDFSNWWLQPLNSDKKTAGTTAMNNNYIVLLPAKQLQWLQTYSIGVISGGLCCWKPKPDAWSFTAETTSL